ncbi:MAG: S41 family peptidase [Clostridia bacterium]|nr:S41 family peptidase [Clostridia bacterium]MBR1683889.1 S41 family peptidase [Clostridia bacterium]MBR2288711.1 S41 family peptidase [Clostridia bacterium]
MRNILSAFLAALFLLLPLSGMAEDTVTIPRSVYDMYRKIDTLVEMMEIVQENYYEDVDEKTLLDGAAQGMLRSLGDPYTFYYTAESFADYMEHQKGEYAGIGIQISTSYVTGLSTISRVFSGSPAQEADVHRGDILVQVEDLVVTPDTITDAVNIMRGTPGTDVEVVFRRGEELLTKTVGRAQITMNRVESCMLENQIGYIRLWEFAGECVSQFTEALDSLTQAGMRGLILDLRDNPGGLLDDAIAIGNHFLDEGVLTYLQYRNGETQYYYTSKGSQEIELVILVNENSASCSELLTGALRDRLGSLVVGVTSFGKGVVQHLMQVDAEGDAMQLTVAQYFTPSGTEVHHNGIEPDHWVELAEGDNGMYLLGDLSDPQLHAAWVDICNLLEE